MKATLKFDLNDPDDYQDFQMHTMTSQMHAVVFDLAFNFMRNFKHISDKEITYDLVQEKVNELLEDIDKNKLQ